MTGKDKETLIESRRNVVDGGRLPSQNSEPNGSVKYLPEKTLKSFPNYHARIIIEVHPVNAEDYATG